MSVAVASKRGTMAPSTTKRQEAELERELLKCCDGWNRDLNRAKDFVELVEIERANVNCADECGWTPLINSARHGNIHFARLLLKNGANVDAANNSGCTSLWYAVHSGNVAMAQLLIEYGAKVESNSVLPVQHIRHLDGQ